MTLKNKTIFITGSSRGIGREIALKCAAQGANIIIAAKSVKPNPELPGTIYSVAEEVLAAGGKALPMPLDVRKEEEILGAVNAAVSHFGGIDILINNASAISLTDTLNTPLKRFDLLFAVNVRATFACTQACLPHLRKSENPHILTLSPPLNMEAKWFKNHLVYSMPKYGMSMCTLGWAEEFKDLGIAANSLWPKTTIATAAIEVHFPKEILLASRKPIIMAEAASYILNSSSKEVSGNFFIDEEVLRKEGVKDFSVYAYNKASKSLQPDLFLD